MHVAIDCRLGGLAHAGIGRYITHLVQELLDQASDDLRLTVLCTSKKQAIEILGSHKKQASVQIKLVPVRHYTFREQIAMLPLLFSLRPDVLHVPHFNAPVLYWGKTVVTIHDLLWHEMRGSSVTTLPAWQYWLKYYLYKFVAQRSITHAAAVLVPTKAVQQTVISFYPSAAPKIAITKEGVAPEFFLKRKPNYNWNRRSVAGLLYVGSLYPHKNISLVLQALQQLPQATLTIVGARSVFLNQVQAEAQALGVRQQVKFVGAVSDQELNTLYRQAAAVVQPSKSEGFGLTGIEAMAAGTPVLCSNIAVFREVYGDKAWYFDPESVQSFVASYTQLKLKKTAPKVIQAFLYAKSFSWQTTAQQTLTMYESVVGQ